MTSYLGRGFESVPGKPFGWAYNREREEIAAHLVKRGWDPKALVFPFRVTRIQERLHRYAPTLRERQAMRPVVRWARPEPFTVEELSRLVELFEAANDPVTASIAHKAAFLLAERGARGPEPTDSA